MVIAVAPVLWLLVTALNRPRAIVASGWNFEFSLSNFATIFEPTAPFTQQLVNSVLIVAGTLVVCLVVAALAGYSLSKLHWPWWVTFPVLALAAFLQLVPPMTLVPGLYLTLYQLGLLGSMGGLILLNVVFNLPFATLAMKVYFDALPNEIRESGMIDGAGEFAVFRRLMLPLVAPGLAAVGVYVAIMTWNEFLMGLTLTTGGTTAPITVGIASLVQPYEIEFGPMAAVGTLTALPIIALAIVANRHIVAGLASGAVKG
ncbi:carbohydrate ABC transporter permease [Streptomyces sp. NPDC056817]|uniref:carbohydrate ABC transporter permease n=1 Tax=Streptomyces sp. NPDC056817 TaxID=3345950 RepID=UPI0036BEEF03